MEIALFRLPWAVDYFLPIFLPLPTEPQFWAKMSHQNGPFWAVSMDRLGEIAVPNQWRNYMTLVVIIMDNYSKIVMISTGNLSGNASQSVGKRVSAAGNLSGNASHLSDLSLNASQLKICRKTRLNPKQRNAQKWPSLTQLTHENLSLFTSQTVHGGETKSVVLVWHKNSDF